MNCKTLSKTFWLFLYLLTGLWLVACRGKFDSNKEMQQLLEALDQRDQVPQNQFAPASKLAYNDSLSKLPIAYLYNGEPDFNKAAALMQLGKESDAVSLLEKLSLKQNWDSRDQKKFWKELAIGYLRIGEKTNCINNHGVQSCIFPISGSGIHLNKSGSEKAIDIYKKLLDQDSTDLESRWLINLAYMTLGQYPDAVPAAYLIPGLNAPSEMDIQPFIDVAPNIGLNINNQAGGSLIDDFDNDGNLDLITSGWDLKERMHFFRNKGDGTFENKSTASGLDYITGGLHLMQTDYNNDGWKDIFVLRGAWKGHFGRLPNSLLRNNKDGTFTDVTKESGMLSFHPTQTATWKDFNNDGWLDVFIGNETGSPEEPHPCELYINNKNGTFTEQAVNAGCAIQAFVKGVSSADYNNDGWQDIFLSTMNGRKILLKNAGSKDQLLFKDVSQEAGFTSNTTNCFPTWFFDFDNDGWQDIVVCGYEFQHSLAYYLAADALRKNEQEKGHVFLYHNLHNGTFEEISKTTGLAKNAFAMGANFGDINNDGFLDFYLGTGNVTYQSLIPNRLFVNNEGKGFIDVTNSARVGSLQKGHGVSIADLDNDGDEDIYVDMGGAFIGDAYQNSLYLNPGQNNNHWIKILLEGQQSNKLAIGTQIKVTFIENDQRRSVYREVNSGASFGANPLLQQIGIGKAALIESLELTWPSGLLQVFRNVKPNQEIHIKEGNKTMMVQPVKKYAFSLRTPDVISCPP